MFHVEHVTLDLICSNVDLSSHDDIRELSQIDLEYGRSAITRALARSESKVFDVCCTPCAARRGNVVCCTPLHPVGTAWAGCVSDRPMSVCPVVAPCADQFPSRPCPVLLAGLVCEPALRSRLPARGMSGYVALARLPAGSAVCLVPSASFAVPLSTV